MISRRAESVFPYFFLTALSLSVGWGIRGNFGHEYGAMIPGALAAMAVVLLSGRPDWWARAAHFGLFGALGWSFGGSISYMQVIAYTHSGHSLSVLYGFACLFLIGFLWAIFGGAGTALPVFLPDAFAPQAEFSLFRGSPRQGFLRFSWSRWAVGRLRAGFFVTSRLATRHA